MPDTVTTVGEASDRLLKLLEDIIDVNLKSPVRVATARSVLEACFSVNVRLQELVNELQSSLGADGILVVILDDNRAYVITVAGGQIIKDQIIDEDNSTPASDSYCKYCVANDAEFVVTDALYEPSLVNNPYIQLVRGYLGSALKVNGQVVGALCATTDNPRHWTLQETAAIISSAKQVSTILESVLQKYT